MSHAEHSQPASLPASDNTDHRIDPSIGGNRDKAEQQPGDTAQPVVDNRLAPPWTTPQPPVAGPSSSPEPQSTPQPPAERDWYTGKTGGIQQSPGAHPAGIGQYTTPQQPPSGPSVADPYQSGFAAPYPPGSVNPRAGYPAQGHFGTQPPSGQYPIAGSQPAGGYPGPAAPGYPRSAPPIPFSARRAGWRRALSTVSGGLINLGQSKSQQQLDDMIARIRRPIAGDFRLAVLSLKGGVGKTTTTVGLGSAFASLRGDHVIAVDANPDFGTLGRRVPQQTGSTVRSLLNDPNIARYADVRRHTSQSASHLEVLASERDPAVSESFSADDYLKVIGILENYYNIIMTDCGTGLMHSAMEGVLSSATAIVLVTSPAVDGAESAAATLDWLNAHGYQRLVQQAVVVISASKPGSAPIDLDMLTQHFLGRTRAVQIIPFDDHLASGAQIDLDEMNRDTRNAFLELAATVSDSFNPGQPGPGFPGFQGPPPEYQQGPPPGYQGPPPGFQGPPPGYQGPPPGYQEQPPAPQGYPATGQPDARPPQYPAVPQHNDEPVPPGAIPPADYRF
nr:MinD/ParA family protein [Gordonia aichiensis]